MRYILNLITFAEILFTVMKVFYKNLRFIFQVYLSGVFIFFLFRLILLFSQWDQIADLSGRSGLLIQSFLIGLRFDNVISCYIIT